MGQPTEPQPTAAAELRRMWREVKTAYYVDQCDTPEVWTARLNLFTDVTEQATQLFNAGDLALLADAQAAYLTQCTPAQAGQARHLFAKLFTFAETTWANMDELACFTDYIEKISQMATADE